MNIAARILAACAAFAIFTAPLAAQEPPPRIGPFVADLHGTFARFPDDKPLADSRGLTQAELPGANLGVDVGLHLYLLHWKAVTFGIGGELTAARSHQNPGQSTATPGLRAVTEKFVSAAPQISLNFGSGRGWSYLSGGVGLSQWSIVPDGVEATDADTERLKTANYGGGARWFIRPHLAFSFDVRIYAIAPGTPTSTFPASPRSTLLVIGAGISVK